MTDSTFVSRAGFKLEHALREVDFTVEGLTCADLGCNVGGFTDCLLQYGAKKIFAVDTGYGTLAWKLRNDDRVITMERTNALHLYPPEIGDLVVIDLGWTPQALALPVAARWVQGGHMISLIKPHYELTNDEKKGESVSSGLSETSVNRVLNRVRETCRSLSLEILSETISPVKGKKSSRKGSGNVEHLMLLQVAS